MRAAKGNLMTDSLLKTLVPWLTVAALAACGGGGDAGSQPPVVTAAFIPAPKYGNILLVTLQGVRLDQGIAGSSAGCRNVTLSRTAPYVSSATAAYFQCTVSADGVQQFNVTRTSDGMVIANPGFTVPTPQVTLDIGDGTPGGVSGSLVITLAPTQAPLTVDNFLAYVNSGFYNGTAFHRHARFDDLSSFVLQGGGYAAPVSAAAAFPAHKPTNAPIVLESGRGLSNVRYTVAMARTADPNSATSEFFINTANNLFLDGSGPNTGYAVFGSVVTGNVVVDAMVAAPCSLSPINFDSGFTVSKDCVPTPNLVIVNATQTR